MPIVPREAVGQIEQSNGCRMRTEQEAKEEEADIQRAKELLIWAPETLEEKILAE